MTRQVAVVAHTHWAREWCSPFETYRMRLVDLLDSFLPFLDADPSYRHFLLDGQMALVDDYLAVRPEAEETLRRLTGAGRLSIGPWYVLMDEFCVSGETIIRNLQLGLERAAAFGGAMPVGYLPDMFGHVAQMPQLLRQAGITHAVVWRGVPEAVTRTGFWWRAPDASTVRAEYLPVGYGNGAYLPEDPEGLVRRLRAHEAELRPLLAGEPDPILLMNGTDHHVPQVGLPGLLGAANDQQGDFHFEQVSLVDYLAGAPTEALPSWTGELRSGARSNLVMGVASNRVDIKVAAAIAEHTLERLAEPLAALWLPAETWPGGLLAEAWLGMIRNSAHDSICACAADEVGRAVRQRYDSAKATAAAIAEQALAVAGLAMSTAGVVVVNPGPFPAAGVVELDLPGGSDVAGAQVISSYPAGSDERVGVGSDLSRFLGELTAGGWLGGGGATAGQVTWTPHGVELALEVDASAVTSRELPSVMAEARAQAGANRDGPLRVRVQRHPSQRVAARVGDVPGYGWAAWQPTRLDVAPVRGHGNWLDNDLVHVAVNPADGTFSCNGLAGLDLLVDGGDEGDAYNYSPPGDEDRVVARPESMAVAHLEGGPVRGRVRVRRTFAWPGYIREGRRVGEEHVQVVTDLEVRAGERLVRVTTHFENRCRDHRLRSLFPLPSRAERTAGDCAFATIARGHVEGGSHAPAFDTFPSRRFVTAGGLTVTHEGLLEHQLVDDGWTLAVTLLRATGMLSRPAPALRPNPARPANPLEASQLLGPLTVRYAVEVGCGNGEGDGCEGECDPYRIADQAWNELRVVRGAGTGPLPPTGSHLRVRGAEVSALHRVGGALELRVYNPHDRGSTVHVEGRSGWLVDLRGQPHERWDGSFGLAPWAIATARLDPAATDV